MRLPSARALGIALLACGTAAAGADTGQLPQAITAGEPTDDFPFVVALVDDSRVPFCTGALVSSVEVSSAAHCFSPPLPPLAAIYFGGAPREDGDGFVAIEHVWIHPEHDPSTNVHDLALVTLAEEPGIDPLPLLEEPLASSAAGSRVRVVGFGENGISPDPLIKRVGWARIKSLATDALRLEPSPATACGGDSGAPVLLDTPDGPRVIGIVSRGDPLCASHALATPIDRTQFPFAPMDGAHCSMAPARSRRTPESLAFLAGSAGCLIALRRRAAHRPSSRRRRSVDGRRSGARPGAARLDGRVVARRVPRRLAHD